MPEWPALSACSFAVSAGFACASRYNASDGPAAPDAEDVADAIEEPDVAELVDARNGPDTMDAADGASELPGNILVNGDFESGCAGWVSASASLQLTSRAWVKLPSDQTMSRVISSIIVGTDSTPRAGECFLIDDVSLVVQANPWAARSS